MSQCKMQRGKDKLIFDGYIYKQDRSHNRFANVVGVAHPDIYRFIKSLRSEQARCEMIRRAALIGEDITAPRKKSVKLNKRIYQIVSSYEERTAGEHFLEYLEGLLHNFTYIL